MKTKYVLTTILMVFALSINLQAQTKKDQSKKTVMFNVSMHCESCQRKIERTLHMKKG